MASDDVIDRLRECSIDDTVIAIVQNGHRFEGQVSGVDHTDQPNDDRETLSVRVVVTDGTIERHGLIRDTVECRADRPADGPWGDVELVAWEPDTDATETGVNVAGSRWKRCGIVDQFLMI